MSEYEGYDEGYEGYGYEDEGGYGDEGYGDEGYEGYDYGEEEGYGTTEDVYATDDPSTWDRYADIGMGRIESKEEKRLRDPRSVSLDKVRAIFNDVNYQDINDALKEQTFRYIEELPEEEMVTYNVDILVPASMFVVMYKEATKKNIKQFLSKTNNLSNINHLDFIRYVRVLTL